MSIRRSFTPRLVVGASLVWIAVAGAGFTRLWSYAYTPGPPAAARASWPEASHVLRASSRPTLVLFLHPQCACSAATVEELARLMAHAQGRVDAQVFVYQPLSEPQDWAATSLWHTAERVPGVRVHRDADAAIATAFGALVSGQTFLYAADGRLLFSGGITAARGHAGDNSGLIAIESQLAPGAPNAAPATSPVFGCLLRGEPL